METYDNWIDGGFAPPPSGRRMATANPFTGSPGPRWPMIPARSTMPSERLGGRSPTVPGPQWPPPSGPGSCAASASF